MTHQKWTLLAAVLLLIGATAGFLARLQSHQKLGQPGLKMIVQSVLDEKGNVVGSNTVDLPLQVLDYHSEPAPVSMMELSWLPSDTTYGHRNYEAPDQFRVGISVVMMGTDRGSIHKPQICMEGQGWHIGQTELVGIPLSRPHPYELPVMRLTCSKDIEQPDGSKLPARCLFAYWFVAENRLTARHLQRMWWMAEEMVRTGTLQRWAYVSCQARCLPGQEEAVWNRMKAFITAAVPEFQLASGPPG